MKTAIGVVLVIIAAIGGSYLLTHHDDHTATCHVTGKDRTSKHDGSSDMRVYTSNCGTLTNNDSFWYGKHRSADLWGEIQPGHTYRFRIAGYRSGFGSTFPNIIEVHPAGSGS